MLQVNGISLHLEDHGSGRPVLLLRGRPDSSYLWRNEIPLLVANCFRAIAPDLRGLGRSDRPEGVAAYSLQNAVGDVVGILDASGIEAADIVGHDLGSRRGVVHCHGPSASRTQARRSFGAISAYAAHAPAARNCLVPAVLPVRRNRGSMLQHGNWALFREVLRGDGDIERYISDLSRPGALAASLHWYRANLAPRLPESSPKTALGRSPNTRHPVHK